MNNHDSRRPRYPHAAAGVWGHSDEPGVRLRIGRASLFIARKHIPSVCNDLQRIASELDGPDIASERRRTLAQWRSLARARGLVIKALEHELAEATKTPSAEQPGDH